jgi:phage shock protein PspC (stress-responsive transcriptional regulator)
MKKMFRPKSSEIAGVCKGLSDYFNIDESIIRIIFIVLVFTPFPIVATYLLMWMLIPKENDEDNYTKIN